MKLDLDTTEKVQCKFIWASKGSSRLCLPFFNALRAKKTPVWNSNAFYYENGKIWSYGECRDIQGRYYIYGVEIDSHQRFVLDNIYNNLEENMELTNKPFRVIAYNDTEIINESTILAAGPQAARDNFVKELVLANNSIDIDSIKIKIVAWTPE